jgi:hypothetical protein
LRTASNEPEARPLPEGATREQAEQVADAAALERRKAIIEQHPPDRNRVRLAALLSRYHASAKAQKWSISHRREQERLRRLWLQELGREALVSSLTDETVENAAAK